MAEEPLTALYRTMKVPMQGLETNDVDATITRRRHDA
jgi:hypothetical protein